MLLQFPALNEAGVNRMTTKSNLPFPPLEEVLANWLTVKDAVMIIRANAGEGFTEEALRKMCRKEQIRAVNIAGQWRLDPDAVAGYRKQRRTNKP